MYTAVLILTLTVLVTTFDASGRLVKQDIFFPVRGDGGSRVGEVRAGTDFQHALLHEGYSAGQ